MSLYKILRPLIFRLDSEKAHNLAINFLHYFPNLATCFSAKNDYENLAQEVCGLHFKSPIGMAAGFDKNAACVKALQQFGFGFVEAGTVTPRAQIGNEKPRIFRLEEDQAIINRLGFNNLGAAKFETNLAWVNPAKSCEKSASELVLGVNIGKNKDSLNTADDYLLLIEKFYRKASYITLNISSPNTKNLRDLQNENQLSDFLAIIMKKRNQLQNDTKMKTPIWLKVAPDLTLPEQEIIAQISLQNQIDALIVANTTISRPQNLRSKNNGEQGGLSGAPLFALSNEVLKNFYRFSAGKIPLIGVGGISSAQDVYEKIKCGASLVQIYSMLIYQGFHSIEKMKAQLSELVEKDGLKNVSQAQGRAV